MGSDEIQWKAPLSDTPKHPDRQLGANPAEYQRKPRLLREMEGVTGGKKDRHMRERSGNRQGSSKRYWKREKRRDGEKEKG